MEQYFKDFLLISDFLNKDRNPEKSSFGKTMWTHLFAAIRAMDFGQCCESGMFIPDSDFFPIPDPESRGQKSTGSRIRIRNTDFGALVPKWVIIGTLLSIKVKPFQNLH
jgi:hypothetical protein